MYEKSADSSLGGCRSHIPLGLGCDYLVCDCDCDKGCKRLNPPKLLSPQERLRLRVQFAEIKEEAMRRDR